MFGEVRDARPALSLTIEDDMVTRVHYYHEDFTSDIYMETKIKIAQS